MDFTQIEDYPEDEFYSGKNVLMHTKDIPFDNAERLKKDFEHWKENMLLEIFKNAFENGRNLEISIQNDKIIFFNNFAREEDLENLTFDKLYEKFTSFSNISKTNFNEGLVLLLYLPVELRVGRYMMRNGKYPNRLITDRNTGETTSYEMYYQKIITASHRLNEATQKWEKTKDLDYLDGWRITLFTNEQTEEFTSLIYEILDRFIFKKEQVKDIQNEPVFDSDNNPIYREFPIKINGKKHHPKKKNFENKFFETYLDTLNMSRWNRPDSYFLYHLEFSENDRVVLLWQLNVQWIYHIIDNNEYDGKNVFGWAIFNNINDFDNVNRKKLAADTSQSLTKIIDRIKNENKALIEENQLVKEYSELKESLVDNISNVLKIGKKNVEQAFFSREIVYEEKDNEEKEEKEEDEEEDNGEEDVANRGYIPSFKFNKKDKLKKASEYLYTLKEIFGDTDTFKSRIRNSELTIRYFQTSRNPINEMDSVDFYNINAKNEWDLAKSFPDLEMGYLINGSSVDRKLNFFDLNKISENLIYSLPILDNDVELSDLLENEYDIELIFINTHYHQYIDHLFDDYKIIAKDEIEEYARKMKHKIDFKNLKEIEEFNAGKNLEQYEEERLKEEETEEERMKKELEKMIKKSEKEKMKEQKEEEKSFLEQIENKLSKSLGEEKIDEEIQREIKEQRIEDKVKRKLENEKKNTEGEQVSQEEYEKYWKKREEELRMEVFSEDLELKSFYIDEIHRELYLSVIPYERGEDNKERIPFFFKSEEEALRFHVGKPVTTKITPKKYRAFFLAVNLMLKKAQIPIPVFPIFYNDSDEKIEDAFFSNGTGIIAFNTDRWLKDSNGKEEKNKQSVATDLLDIVCHELAHYYQSGHNKHHSYLTHGFQRMAKGKFGDKYIIDLVKKQL